MDSRPAPAEPVSQVAFIHDYFQLVFQEERFTVYNKVAISDGENVIRQGSVGFCDKLVEFIGQSVVAVTQTDAYVLCLRFSGGATFQVEADHDPLWPEAFDFIGRSQFRHTELNRRVAPLNVCFEEMRVAATGGDFCPSQEYRAENDCTFGFGR